MGLSEEERQFLYDYYSRIQDAWDIVKRASALLKERGIQRILLYGDLLWGDFNQYSRIEIYIVDRCSWDSMLTIMEEAEAISKKLNIYCDGLVPAGHKELILKFGVEI